HLSRDACPPFELFERSRLVTLRGVPIRVLSPEDHFRLVCVHMFQHGNKNPRWLCDVAALLESLPEDFDWRLCLYGAGSREDWVPSAARLAHVLLDARLPRSLPNFTLPDWMVYATVRNWGAFPECRTPVLKV